MLLTIELPNPYADFCQSSTFKSNGPTPSDFFFFPESPFPWMTSNSQPVEIFTKLLAFCTNLIADGYFPTTDETNCFSLDRFSH